VECSLTSETENTVLEEQGVGRKMHRIRCSVGNTLATLISKLTATEPQYRKAPEVAGRRDAKMQSKAICTERPAE
jgi:hypothetical protein